MTFDKKIDLPRDDFLKNIELSDLSPSTRRSLVKRVGDITFMIRIFFKAFLATDFDKTSIKQPDIKQSVCKYIENLNDISSVDFSIVNKFIKYMTEYSLDIDYIIENYTALKYINDCEHNKHIICKQ